MKTKSVPATPEMKAAREAVLEALKPHQEKLDALEILALLAHTLGQVVAFQDQHKVTREMALEIIIANIEAGNAEVLDSLRHNSEGSA